MEIKSLEKDIYRGDIYYANLDSNAIGSEQTGTRPVLVVQNNIGNRYSATVIVVPLTKKSEIKLNQPTHYLLKENGNIKYDSIVLTEQIRAIDKQRLTEKIDYLKYDIMQEIDKKLVIALGLKNIQLHINTLGDQESRDAYREALQNHFQPVLNELCHDCQVRYEKNPLRILDCKVDKNHPMMKTAPKTIDYLTDNAKAHFEKVCALLDDLEIDYVVDPNLVRGLDYYSHTVFEIISDDPKLGAGSTVGGGGRYNGLVEELGGPQTPGVGFAFGMERLMIALGDDHEDEEGLDVYIMPLGSEAKDLAMQIMTMLRANGFTCDMDQCDRGLKGQFKSADRYHAHFSMIIGEEEVKKEVVNMKCNHSKEQVEVPLENIVEFIENHFEGDYDHE